MKKNFLLATMALFMTLFASSCSQEEIISDNNSKEGGTVSVAVNIPVNNPVTRAIPNIPEGYKLRCILQLVKASDNSNIADGRYVQEVAAGSEKVTFTFNAPSDTYKCLFWADYVKEDVAADNIYTTTDLKAIGYTANAGSEMFNGDVADAFYACSLEPVTGNGALASITLKRPFTKITFKDGQSAYTDYTKITIKDLPAPTGFNVMNGETAGYTGKDAYTDSKISSSELTVENGKWFSAYLFASSNKENLGAGNDIVFELKKADNTSSGELKLNGASITLTENVEVEATVEPKKDGDTSIDVIFPDGMVDPNTLAVGDFINKDGTYSKTYNGDKAIGIVYALKTSSITDESQYNTDKKIIGYAMGLTSVERTALNKEVSKDNFEVLPSFTNTSTDTSAPWIIGDYNGYTYCQTFETTISSYESPLFTAYATWKTENAINSGIQSLSTWYIPSSRQLADIIGAAYGYNGDMNDSQVTDLNIPAITKNEAFAAAINQLPKAVTPEGEKEKSYFGNNSSKSNILSSFIRGGRFMCVQTNFTETIESISSFLGVTVKNTAAAPFTIRPVLTVFDGIQKATDSAQ